MLDLDLLRSIATHLLSAAAVEVSGRSLRVWAHEHAASQDGQVRNERSRISAIEQNPDKPSQWGRLARAGHQVVQFEDVQTNKFIAVAVNGKVIEYGSRRKTGHPGAERS